MSRFVLFKNFNADPMLCYTAEDQICAMHGIKQDYDFAVWGKKIQDHKDHALCQTTISGNLLQEFRPLGQPFRLLINTLKHFQISFPIRGDIRLHCAESRICTMQHTVIFANIFKFIRIVGHESGTYM
jgi:hypothetical protein